MIRDWKRLLVEDVTGIPQGFRGLRPPTVRGTTTVFNSARDAAEHWDSRVSPYSYGIHGTPTSLELAERISRLEGSFGTFLVPSGQAAIAVICMAVLHAGEHVLLPDSAYGPGKAFVAEILSRFGVEHSLYPPLAGEGITQYIHPNTRLIFCESPGSVTMEIQDVSAIARAAHARGIVVALDNTYAAGVLFDAFAAGVDISLQALTKYLNGHSDVFLGSISVANDELYQVLGGTLARFGMAVSPEDCSLVLRGLQTLAVRLDAIEHAALHVARWLAERPEIEAVLHPALPSCPGHDVWLRDWSGSTGVFSIMFKDSVDIDDIVRFVDELEIFKIGYSWGGVTSLAVPYLDLKRAHRLEKPKIVRLHVGLEPVEALIGDLEQALFKVSGDDHRPIR